MGKYVDGEVSFLNYNSNSWRHFSHFPLSCPGGPRRNTLPIVLQTGHIPVVAFFGPVRIIFWVFLLPIRKNISYRPIKFNFSWRGEGDLNPRVLADMGLAIPRPTRLGDPRTRCLELVCK